MALGIDVGGANLKYSNERGEGEIIYLPIWKNIDLLESKLRDIKGNTDPDRVGAVITAELSDVFKNKSEGVLFISSLLKKVFDEVFFLTVDGELLSSIDDPLRFSASNWVASTLYLKKEYDNFLFVDIGSTTADFIPVREKILAAKTDFERIKRGELLYIGALRTPICYLARDFYYPLASEFFAIVADAFLLTGDISEEGYTVETPDGRGKSRRECMARLARMFCADVEEVGEDLFRFAEWIKRLMVKTVSNAIQHQLRQYELERVIGCGVGEFLIRRVMEELDVEYISLTERYGDASNFFPSFAIANLVTQE